MSNISVTGLLPARIDTQNLPKFAKDVVYYIEDSEIKEIKLYEFLDTFSNEEVNTPIGILPEFQIFQIGKKFVFGVFRNSKFYSISELCGIREAAFRKYDALMRCDKEFYYERETAEVVLAEELNQE